MGANVENLTLLGTAAINGTGNTLNNVLIGSSVNNILNGGAGADTLRGVLGNDTYVVENIGDVVIENINEGNDTVQSSITYTLGANVENLTLLGTAAINGTGNTLNNVLIGSSVNNILNGGAGADTLRGGLGNDTYVVESAGDVVIESESVNEGDDTVQSSISYALGTNVERLTLISTGAINGTGNGLNNMLVGNGADNVLNGGAGNDTLSGGVGNDTYVIDSVGDIVTEGLNEGTDLVQSVIAYTLMANMENLMLTGISAINGAGNELNNILTGNSAINLLTGGIGNDTLNGGAGADTLIGGLGNDTYVVENIGDVVIESVNEDDDIVQSSISYTLGANVERLTLISTGAINGTGNGLNNMLVGNGADNVLNGGGGDDVLDGQGSTTPVAPTINSLVIRAKGSQAYGGSPTMQVRVGGVVVAQMEVTATSYTDYVISPATLGMVAQDIDVVFTNDAYDAATKSDRNLYVQAVIVNGTQIASNDRKAIVDFGGGSAAFDGVGWVRGKEPIWSNGALRVNLADSDLLNGGAGKDIMAGGVGNDRYVVDHAADVINEQANGGFDSVESSVSYTLAQNVEILTLTGAENTNATGNTGANTLDGNVGNNTLDGGAGADRMYGGKGDAAYLVDHTGDAVGENYDQGVDTIQSSVTYTLGTNIENLTLAGIAAVNGTGNGLNNALVGNGANNILNGGAANDSLIGGAGNDTYMFGRGYGVDTVTENDAAVGNGDLALFGSGITNNQLWFTRAGNNLDVSIIGTSDRMVMKDWYLGNQYHAEQFKTADGKMLLDSRVDALVSAMASFAPPAAGQTTLSPEYETALAPVLAANWQ